MKEIPDNYIDLSLTDIPYNLKQYDITRDKTTNFQKRHGKMFNQEEANTLNFDLKEFCKQQIRITKKLLLYFVVICKYHIWRKNLNNFLIE